MDLGDAMMTAGKAAERKVQDRWEQLSASINEELNETTEMLPMEAFQASLSVYSVKGWRQRPFYKGDVFTVVSTRVGKKPTLLFKLIPISPSQQFIEEGHTHAEADISKMKTIFGEAEFNQFMRNVLGCSIEDAIETIGMKVDPKTVAPMGEDGKPLKSALERDAEYGTW